jgi:hypothetical protein
VPRRLPLLLVVAALALLAWRLVTHPGRGVALDRLDDPTISEADVDTLLARYPGDDDLAWAAARAYLRIGNVRKAIDAVWTPGEATPTYGPRLKRFGELGLRTIGWADGDHYDGPTPLAFFSLASLIDGGAPGAREALSKVVRTQSKLDVSFYYRGILRRGGAAARDAVLASLRPLPSATYRLATASIAMGPKPYPERDADRDVLLASLNGDLRTAERPRWGSVCISLGHAEEKACTEALRALSDRLAASETPADREDAAVAAAGIVAAGDWTMEERILPFVATATPSPNVAPWYLEAVLWRYERGDPYGVDRLRTMWDETIPGAVAGLRVELGWSVLLGDEPPRPEVPVERFEADLCLPSSPALARMVGYSSRLRRKDAAAPGEILGLLALAPSTSVAGGAAHPHADNPVVMGFRGIYLYGGT